MIIQCLLIFIPFKTGPKGLVYQNVACMISRYQTMNTTVYLTYFSSLFFPSKYYYKTFTFVKQGSFHFTLVNINLIETNQSVQELNCIKKSGTIPDSPKSSQTSLNLLSRPSKNLSNCLENHQTVRKSSWISVNLPNCPEIFHTVWKPSILPGNLPDCLEIL